MRKVILAVALALAMVAGDAQVHAQIQLTNDDIVEMVTAGVSDGVITTAIWQARRRLFDLSPAAIADLKKKNVSDAVIAEMQKASAGADAPAHPGRSVESVAPPAAVDSESLTPEQAAEIIRQSALFTSYETVVVRQNADCGPGPGGPGGRGGFETGRGLDALRSAGLIRCGNDRRIGVTGQRQWRQIDPDSWEVPMGRRSVVGVTGIRRDGQGLVASYSWRWVSAQPRISAGRGTYTGEARFERTGGGWRLAPTFRDYFYDRSGRLLTPPTWGYGERSVALGQSIAEVEAALGKPQEIRRLGDKTVYSYKNQVVTFTNGVVTDVQ